MTTAAFQRAEEFEGQSAVSIRRKGEALEVEVRRGDIDIRVLIPEAVLEWYVDVEHRQSGLRAKDWYDYEGYDHTPIADLDQSMADEVSTFISRSIGCELRFVEDTASQSKGRLEWFVDGRWQQAVPAPVGAA